MTTPAGQGITLTVNGTTFDIPASTITPFTTLNDFIRNRTPFHGTKVSCAEGGCGSCTVALVSTDATTGQKTTRAANSCLALLQSLDGFTVITNDGLAEGDVVHQEVQQRLAKYYGTQCGYCSSGMTMSMYAFLSENPSPTELEIEQMLDGNLCRCTGYRPILTAFKTFASNGGGTSCPPSRGGCNKAKCCKKLGGRDIEIEDAARTVDLSTLPAKPPSNKSMSLVKLPTTGSAEQGLAGAPPTMASAPWHNVVTEANLQFWLNHYSGMKVMITVGATSQALQRISYDAYIDVSGIPNFKTITQAPSTGVTLGAAVTIADLLSFLSTCTGPTVTSTAHFAQLQAHLHRVASKQIRNRASVVGNMVWTHMHQTPGNVFPSDVCIALMGIGAKVNVYDLSTSTTTNLSMTDFFSTSMTGKYVQSVVLPWGLSNEVFKSYKIAIRQTLDHAIVNGGMRATVNPTTNKVTGMPTIAVGGLFGPPTRLTAVENAMTGVDVTKPASIASLVSTFKQAVASGVDPAPGRVAYRQSVATNYFYKFLLALQPTLSADLQEAASVWLGRTVSNGTQTFATSDRYAPASQAIPKVDGIEQTTGTAQYTADIPRPFGTLFAMPVINNVANAAVTAVDTTVAATVPGFVKYITTADIPAGGSADWGFFGTGYMMQPTGPANVLTRAGVFIGVVVADTFEAANHCRWLIEAGLQYGQQTSTPIVTLAAAEAAQSGMQQYPSMTRQPTTEAPTGLTTVKGTVSLGSQFHFHLENHVALAQTIEKQVVVDSASQGPIIPQNAVAKILGLSLCDVVVRTRRCGGAYGGKILAPGPVSAMAALASHVVGRPVLLELPFKDGMKCFGCRPEYSMSYTVQVNPTTGKIWSFDGTMACTSGDNQQAAGGELLTAIRNVDNCYNFPSFRLGGVSYTTNVPQVASVRGPGWIPGIALGEMMMNDVATTIGLSPAALRATNLYQEGTVTPAGMPIVSNNLTTMWDTQYAKYLTLKAQVEQFNTANKFVKRGIAISPSRFVVGWGGPFNAYVAVYPDATITITHGGVEVGQGINTKVAQGCASVFGLTMDEVQNKIRVQTNTSCIAANPGNITGGSVTSEMCTMAVMRACEVLKGKLDPYMGDGVTFAAAVGQALQYGVDLTATGFGASQGNQGGQNSPFPPGRYNTFGCATSVVEVDALTGQFQIKQTDLIFDCGLSLNPDIDIGQIEGGFMFGVGYFTSEIVRWNAQTGSADTAGSWLYKPPGAYDVPEQLNVTLLPNSYNKVGVLGSKAVGEPPLALAVSVAQAIESAVNAVRTDASLPVTSVGQLPVTVDRIATLCAVSPADYTLS